MGILMSSSPAEAQDTLRGVVYDASLNLPLAGAFVRSGHRTTDTDLQGRFALPITENESVLVGHPDFHRLRIPFDRIHTGEGIRLFLTPGLTAADMQTNVEAVRTPQFEYVYDYLFDGDHLLVLSYMNQKSGGDRSIDPFVNCALTVLRRGEQIERLILPDYTQNIRSLPNGDLWITTGDSCYRLLHDGDTHELLTESCALYYDTLRPITGVLDTGVFATHEFPIVPEVTHSIRYPHMDHPRGVRTVRNPRYFDRVADDYAMLTSDQLREAENLAAESGLDPTFYAPYLRRHQYVIDTERPYAPGFVVDDRYLVFDPMNQWLFFHDADGSPIDSVPAYYEWGKEELEAFVQDPFTEKIYAVHDRGGVRIIREIHPETGAAGEPHKIAYPFPENIQVYQGYVYYIRHIVKGESNKHLYREKLPEGAHVPLDEN